MIQKVLEKRDYRGRTRIGVPAMDRDMAPRVIQCVTFKHLESKEKTV
jgi:hypothetical protein